MQEYVCWVLRNLTTNADNQVKSLKAMKEHPGGGGCRRRPQQAAGRCSTAHQEGGTKGQSDDKVTSGRRGPGKSCWTSWHGAENKDRAKRDTQ